MDNTVNTIILPCGHQVRGSLWGGGLARDFPSLFFVEKQGVLFRVRGKDIKLCAGSTAYSRNRHRLLLVAPK